jgi:hypothetical protein
VTRSQKPSLIFFMVFSLNAGLVYDYVKGTVVLMG